MCLDSAEKRQDDFRLFYEEFFLRAERYAGTSVCAAREVLAILSQVPVNLRIRGEKSVCDPNIMKRQSSPTLRGSISEERYRVDVIVLLLENVPLKRTVAGTFIASRAENPTSVEWTYAGDCCFLVVSSKTLNVGIAKSNTTDSIHNHLISVFAGGPKMDGREDI